MASGKEMMRAIICRMLSSFWSHCHQHVECKTPLTNLHDVDGVPGFRHA